MFDSVVVIWGFQVFGLTSILENANTNQQLPTTTCPITTATSSHLNHKSERKISKSQPTTTAHPPTHPPQPPSHPKNPIVKKKKKPPLTLTDSRSEILAVVFLVKLDPSNERRSDGDKAHLGPLIATSPTTKWAKI